MKSAKPFSVSVPLWMIEYIRATPEIRPSTLFQMAIMEEKKRLDTEKEYKICTICNNKKGR